MRAAAGKAGLEAVHYVRLRAAAAAAEAAAEAVLRQVSGRAAALAAVQVRRSECALHVCCVCATCVLRVRCVCAAMHMLSTVQARATSAEKAVVAKVARASARAQRRYLAREEEAGVAAQEGTQEEAGAT